MNRLTENVPWKSGLVGDPILIFNEGRVIIRLEGNSVGILQP